MRSAGGDYARFLARVASPSPRTEAPAGARPTPTRKPSRYGAHPMRRREPARVLAMRSLHRSAPSLVRVFASARRRGHTSFPTDFHGFA